MGWLCHCPALLLACCFQYFGGYTLLIHGCRGKDFARDWWKYPRYFKVDHLRHVVNHHHNYATLNTYTQAIGSKQRAAVVLAITSSTPSIMHEWVIPTSARRCASATPSATFSTWTAKRAGYSKTKAPTSTLGTAPTLANSVTYEQVNKQTVILDIVLAIWVHHRFASANT